MSWDNLIDELNASFDLGCGVSSRSDLCVDRILSIFEDHGTAIALHTNTTYPDLDSEGESKFLVETLLGDSVDGHIWLINTFCEIKRNAPFRIEGTDFEEFVSTYSKLHENWAVLDGEVIVFCPQSRVIGVLTESGDHASYQSSSLTPPP